MTSALALVVGLGATVLGQAPTRSAPVVLGGIGTGYAVLTGSGTMVLKRPTGDIPVRLNVAISGDGHTPACDLIGGDAGVNHVRAVGFFTRLRRTWQPADYPADVTVTAISPFVPHDRVMSAQPCCGLVVRIRNRGLHACRATLTAAAVMPAATLVSNVPPGLFAIAGPGVTLAAAPQDPAATVEAGTALFPQAAVPSSAVQGAGRSLSVSISLRPGGFVEVPFCIAWSSGRAATATAIQFLETYQTVDALAGEWTNAFLLSDLPPAWSERVIDAVGALAVTVPESPASTRTSAAVGWLGPPTQELGLWPLLRSLYPRYAAELLEANAAALVAAGEANPGGALPGPVHHGQVDTRARVLALELRDWRRTTGNVTLVANLAPIMREALDTGARTRLESQFDREAAIAASEVCRTAADMQLTRALPVAGDATLGMRDFAAAMGMRNALLESARDLAAQAAAAPVSDPSSGLDATRDAISRWYAWYDLSPGGGPPPNDRDRAAALVDYDDPSHLALEMDSIRAGSSDARAWRLLAAVEGLRIDVARSELWCVPSLPPAWRRLDAPVYCPTFTGSIMYQPRAQGYDLEVRVDRLTAASFSGSGGRPNALDIAVLAVPAGHPGATYHASIRDAPLALLVEANDVRTARLRFRAPLHLQAGDRLRLSVSDDQPGP